VLGSGSRGNSTLVETETTRLIIDAGFSKRETYARLAAIGARSEGFRALVISHEHADHVNGLRSLAADLKVPVYISATTRESLRFDFRSFRLGSGTVSRVEPSPSRATAEGDFGAKAPAWELFTPGKKFAIGDIEITPFSVPHDAADPVAFTLETQGIKIGLVTDLGCIPEVVKQHVRGCHLLVFESNHDLEMLKVGPYPWHLKQRLMSRHGHLSNRTTADFLSDDYDGRPEILVLAHLSETNNHPEVARLSAEEALGRRSNGRPRTLHLASQSAPTPVFSF
jgi:phosphoribosyl 1,2-cyclic phosphodiesterase